MWDEDDDAERFGWPDRPFSWREELPSFAVAAIGCSAAIWLCLTIAEAMQ